MVLFDYQIDSVIQAYLKNMAIRANSANADRDAEFPEDQVTISEEAMKRMFFKRIRNHMTERLRKHNP
jgi:hypothetical protein